MRSFAFITLAAIVAATTTAAARVNTVGDVQAVERNAYGTPPNATKAPKREGDPIAYQELLETLAKSGLLVRFADGSKLTLGADSRLLVDDFVYDPGDTHSKALISLPAGTLRYVTGSMPKGQTTIDTPTATLVLRGTNVAVDAGKSDTLLYVHEGRVSVHSKLTGQDTIVNEGSSVLIGANGIVSTDEERTGDPLVDNGFAANTDPSSSERRGAHNENHNGDKPNAGGSSTGGSSSSSGGSGTGSYGG